MTNAPPLHVSLDPPTSGGRAFRVGDSLRGVLAGRHAVTLMASSVALFEAGGRHILSGSAQQAVRQIAERGAARALVMTGVPVVAAARVAAVVGEPVVAVGVGTRLGSMGGAAAIRAGASKGLVRGVGTHAARLAGREILKGAGRAAGVGFVLDGALAGFEALASVRNGSSDKVTAMKYVAKEATTGALATGAGVLLGAGLVALTGGMAAPVVFAVGAVGSIGAKQFLRKILK